MASPAFPEPPSSQPATPIPQVDECVDALHGAAAGWVSTSLDERIALLRACMPTLAASYDDWVAAGTRAKGGTLGSGIEGEIALGGPMVCMRHLRLLAESLEAVRDGRDPPVAGRTTLPDGQEVVHVFPAHWMDKVLFTGFKGDVWVEPGKPSSLAGLYRAKAEGGGPAGGVSLVLGAGNVSSIGPLDVIHKLFVEDEVVLLKTNPVNAYLGPILEQAFAPLIEAGVLAIVHGGAEVGGHLCHHPKIVSVHITGSDSTHDAIVWGGAPQERARRKATGEPILTKPITSELGCVTPVFVVPGPWSEADLQFQAEHVASMVAHNGSFNCNAAKVLVLAKGWEHRDAFVLKVREALAHTEPRKAYYPGAKERYSAFRDRYPGAIPLSEDTPEIVPWTVIPEVPAKKGEYALTHEAFCGVLAEVDIDATEADEFLGKAVDFANDSLWGTLSCVVLVHPKTQKAHPEAFHSAISNLQYGGIGINVWGGVIYGLICTTWGAYPGHTLEDIVSGRGFVHNTFLVDHPQKSVLEAPFRIAPKPAWFHNHGNLPELGRRLTHFEEHPGLGGLVKVAMAAFKG